MYKRIFLFIPILIISILLLYMLISGKGFNDIALSGLQFIKTLKGDKVATTEFNHLESQPINHKIWDALLKRHIDSKGLVSYKGFIEDKKELDQYLELISNNPPSEKWKASDQLAFWINAYNAFTVKLIIDHYPAESIKNIGGNISMINSPWDIKFFKIGNIEFDLNTIEHEILRKKFDEPRIHFAINCASISCPDLRNEAYTGKKIERQLSEQTHLFLADRSKNNLSEKALKLSKIFDWFKSDFTKNSTLIEFLNQYSEITINPEASIDFLDYDWGLNHQSL